MSFHLPPRLSGDQLGPAAERMHAGCTIAFVGDGIHDAAALARSHVAIARGSGTGVAQAQADIVLMRKSITALPTVFALAQCTLRTIRQTLALSLGYSLLLVPLAAGLLYPALGVRLSPGFAALAMSLSSLSVVANSLLLRRRVGSSKHLLMQRRVST
jgi:P-type Cu+ transporter